MRGGIIVRNDIFLKICATLLAVCVVLSSLTAVQIGRVYAEEGYSEGFDPDPSGDEGGSGDADVPDPDPDPDPEPDRNPPSPYQPDPFDYNLICYTPSISFGTVYAGDTVQAKQFQIVNVGRTHFPLTWEEIDQYTAFDLGYISPDLDMDPGESVTFSISPNQDLAPGSYVASYTFFSANDYRRHHTARVDVTITVKDVTPYITGVDVIPGSVSIPEGKSYKFDANVSGGNGYDPSVTWSLMGNQLSDTTIDSDGRLTVAVGEGSGSFAVIATSNQDPSYSDTALVTVKSVDYVVSVKADPADGGAVAGGGAVRAGDNCSISASPNNNYVFKGWYEGGNLLSNDRQFVLRNVSGDMDMVAKFERNSCFIRTGVNDSNAGTVTDSGSVAYGGKFTITAKAKSDYKFVGFVENNQTISTASSIELNNITTDRTIIAVFDREKCNVNVSVYPQDTGKYEGAGTYSKGSRCELRAEAYDGYEFAGWSINGQIVSTDRKYTIEKVKGDVNVVANFMKKSAPTYKLTSGIATPGGSVVPSGDYVASEGSSVTYNIVPQAGYNIVAVMVDGKNVGAASSYTFNNIRGGHTIVASFEKKPAPAPAPSGGGQQGGGSSQTPASKKQDTPKKTEYNDDTAAEGAIPQQKVIDVVIPENQGELDGEEYEDDVYTQAQDVQIPDTPAAVGSVMARHDIDEGTLRILINDDAVLPMLREAFEDGTLKITVNNSYAEDTQETAAQLYYSKPTLINFEDVIAETLTANEKYAVLTGTPVYFNIDITENTSSVDASVKQQIQKKVGYKPVSYFDFMILKSMGGTTTVINKTSSELEVVVPIPEEFRKAGRRFFVIRNHNGAVDILEDIGNDPTTVTFRTDRFSEYAIAYEAININKLILRFAIIAVVSLILAVICFVNLVKYKRKARVRAKS